MHENKLPYLNRFLVQLGVFVQEVNHGELGYNDNNIGELQCMKALGLDAVMRPPSATVSVRWFPPQTGFVKINTDRSEVNGYIQGGAMYRDSMGFVIATFMRKLGKGQAFEAELLIAMEGVTSALMKELSNIVLESDSTYVVSLFNNTNSVIPWKYRSLWAWMMGKLQDVEFMATHIYREGNTVADAISIFRTSEDYIWWDDIPEFILQLAAKDRYMEYFCCS